MPSKRSLMLSQCVRAVVVVVELVVVCIECANLSHGFVLGDVATESCLLLPSDGCCPMVEESATCSVPADVVAVVVVVVVRAACAHHR